MKKQATNNRPFKEFVILICILFVAFAVRLYKINTPLADFHSWRQVDTAAVARNFVDNGINLLQPRYHDLSNVQSGLENPNGYRYVEFPLYGAGMALAHITIPTVSIEIWGRLLSIISSLFVLSIVYYFVLRESGLLAAAVAGISYAVFPFIVFFSRVVLPDPTALAFAFLTLFCLYKFAQQRSNNLVSYLYITAWTLCFAAGLLVKPTVIFFGIAALFLLIRKYKWDVLKKPVVYIFFIAALAPFVLWRSFINQFPEGIPASDWLITMVNTSEGRQVIFMRPAFFRWIFFERINNIILGGFLSAFLIVGLLAKPKRYFLHSIFVSSLVYLFVFQGGNVQHEYYQILIFPALAIFVGVGIDYLYRQRRQFINTAIVIPTIFFLFLFSLFISYYQIRDYYNYPQDLVSIAKIIQDLTNKNDLIVTDTTGDTTLLYLSNRRGAPSVYTNLPELKKKGYVFFVTQNGSVIEELKKENIFEPVFESDKFALFKL